MNRETNEVFCLKTTKYIKTIYFNFSEIQLFVKIYEHLTPYLSALLKNIESCVFSTNCNIYSCFKIIKKCTFYNDLLFTEALLLSD